ncbi:MAG: hypothetical protein RR548_01800 [Carnobacterium sp.]|uniref:YolD-like protein n=1 Tax=Carnobacterium antarcticum TaxID=2126436 RepID=A0ABW4NM87_9LACT|nr:MULTISPECIES: hypothetical protein [unclassified Carnobacterium]ALV20924.1 hypothetical protein NY10_304 [Carnobacterium sp. CP1]QQP71076.1 hypothetical protein JHE06_04695 [Carnobacterium sp. CS13]
MEKNFAEKSPAFFNTFNKKLFLTKEPDTLQVFPQMPEHQIRYFLMQAYERRKPIVLQMNKTKHILTIDEQKGILRYAPNKKSLIILESLSRQTTYMLSFEDIRHVRLAQ